MKLSDVKGDHVLDVIADIIDPIVNIATDEGAHEMFKPQAVPDGMEAREFFAMRMRKGMPALLKGHKHDIIAILAAIEGVTPEEYTDMLNLAKLFTDTIELLTDEAFISFLSSPKTKKDADASGSALESFEVL